MPKPQVTVVCPNNTCPDYDAVTNKRKKVTQDQGKPMPKCPSCQTKMVNNPSLMVEREADPFKGLADRVRRECATQSPSHQYVRAVVDFLDSDDGKKFQGDFNAEMKKEIDFGKFTKNNPARSELAGDVCVDNAMNNAGTELPDGCPVGEKFTFEIPYIMQTAGWTHMAFCHNAPILTKEFAEFRKSVQSKRQYLVVWTQNKGQSESHMICITVDGSRSAMIHDPQEQPNNYAGGFCEAWESPSPGGAALNPRCSLDLKTGKTGEYS